MNKGGRGAMHKAALGRIIPREADPDRNNFPRRVFLPKPVCEAGQKFAIGGGQGNGLLKRKIAIIRYDGDITSKINEP